MNRIIAIAALTTIALAAYDTSANPFDNSNFPNDDGQSANSDGHGRK
jgi:hypothetical protein